MDFHSEEISQLPDLLFAQLCDDKYEINKGVLNMIDLWFYKRGLCQIIERRKTILSFFHYIKLTENSVKKIKFGPGGLTIRLEKFWNHQGEPLKQVYSHA